MPMHPPPPPLVFGIDGSIGRPSLPALPLAEPTANASARPEPQPGPGGPFARPTANVRRNDGRWAGGKRLHGYKGLWNPVPFVDRRSSRAALHCLAVPCSSCRPSSLPTPLYVAGLPFGRSARKRASPPALLPDIASIAGLGHQPRILVFAVARVRLSFHPVDRPVGFPVTLFRNHRDVLRAVPLQSVAPRPLPPPTHLRRAEGSASRDVRTGGRQRKGGVVAIPLPPPRASPAPSRRQRLVAFLHPPPVEARSHRHPPTTARASMRLMRQVQVSANAANGPSPSTRRS